MGRVSKVSKAALPAWVSRLPTQSALVGHLQGIHRGSGKVPPGTYLPNPRGRILCTPHSAPGTGYGELIYYSRSFLYCHHHERNQPASISPVHLLCNQPPRPASDACEQDKRSFLNVVLRQLLPASSSVSICTLD